MSVGTMRIWVVLFRDFILYFRIFLPPVQAFSPKRPRRVHASVYGPFARHRDLPFNCDKMSGSVRDMVGMLEWSRGELI